MSNNDFMKIMKTQIANSSLCERYHNVCNELAEQVNKQLFEGCRRWKWIYNKSGDACDFDNNDILTSNEMLLIVEYGIDQQAYAEWHNANLANGFYLNLRSWMAGARHRFYVAKNERSGI